MRERRRKSSNHSSVGTSRWLVGSSSSSSSGSCSKRAASAARIFQPPESSEAGRCSAACEKPRPLKISSARWRPYSSSWWTSCSCSSASSPPSSICSSSEAARASAASTEARRVVSQLRPGTLESTPSISEPGGSSDNSCGRYPARALRTSCTAPPSGSTPPARIFISVDFPLPLGPISPTRSWCPRAKLASSRRTLGP